MANPKKIQATVKSIQNHGKGIYQLTIECTSRFPRFKPGQFLHLTVDDFNQSQGYWPESRVFSIARVTNDKKEVSIIYSVKGCYTKKMEDELQPGRDLWLKAPYGDFIIANHIEFDDRIVLIAGGTGISPFIPFMVNWNGENDIVLNYGLRSIEHLIFNDDLSIISHKKGFHLNLFIEEDEKKPDGLKTDHFVNEMLSIDRIKELSGINKKDKYFISGPPGMIEAFKNELTAIGVDSSRIIIDEWS